MYCPLPFDELLEECPGRVARISQVEKWLGEHVDYYEWCSMIWSLTDLEGASEEYAFTCIYERLSDLNNLHKLEPQIRAILEEYPDGDKENPELWKWYKKHEKFYQDHLLFFQPDHQNYEYHMLGHREDLTVPMACFRDNAIYLDKEDFSFVFDFLEKYEPLTYTPVPENVTQNPEYAEFIQCFESEPNGSEQIAREIREHELELEKQDIVGKSALHKLRNFHETMVDIADLEEWLEEHAMVQQRLEDNHDFDCWCGICSDFKPLYQDMSDLVNAYHQKRNYRNFLNEYEALAKDTRSLAVFFLKYYSMIKSLHMPLSIEDVADGLVSYNNFYEVSERFCFVFADEPWKKTFRELPWFKGMMNAMYFYLLDRFNKDHKSFYLQYDFDKICQHFGDKLIDEAAFFFEIYYELAVRFPHIITPEGKFLE